MKLDRGPSFGAYYLVDPAKPQEIFGLRAENSWPCGTFTVDGITKGVTFFHFLKDLHPTAIDDPKHAETFDVAAPCGDKYRDSPVMGGLLMGADVTEALKALKPVPKGLVDKDLKEGKNGEQIVNERAGVLVGEFLGFTLANVLRDFPEIWQPTVVDGNEVPNIMKCSMETI